MRTSEAIPDEKPTYYLVDRFEDDRPGGQVVGSHSPEGFLRRGADVEGVISIDHGALRIRPPMQPGWGRAGIAYGPYRRANGLAFGVHILNGHNTSQTGHLMTGLPKRILRWLRGSGADDVHRRFASFLLKGDKRTQTRQLRRWFDIERRHKNDDGPTINENLAIGWFGDEKPVNPLNEGNSFIVHATGAENGELWTRSSQKLPPIIKGLQNIPLVYLVVLRKRGAAYYAGSLPGVQSLPPYPTLRPLAIDPIEDDESVYAALYQSVLGQIGFRVDTRVYSVQVKQLQAFDNWYGTAHAADRLAGNSPLAGTAAEIGGTWGTFEGGFRRTTGGARATCDGSFALLDPGQNTGLIHILLKSGTDVTAQAGLIWRQQDLANYWSLQLSGDGCRLMLKQNGEWHQIALDAGRLLQASSMYSIQILDDGQMLGLYLNGELLFDKMLSDRRLGEATGIGLCAKDVRGNYLFHSYEAHPRTIPMPTAFDFEDPWFPKGSRVVAADDFADVAGDLADRPVTSGDGTWRKALGKGIFELTGDGAVRVRGNATTPNPNRTAYTIDWPRPDFADIQVDITPPGSGRGQLEMGRSGLIFWQDADNYIIVNTWLDDVYEGASISSFFYLQGYEDLFDAVWTNVGGRILWGTSYTLRIVFDGLNYLVLVDGEPVLYRALTDVYPDCESLAIRRVGLVANWEWGNDSGSTFENFLAKE